MTFDEWEAQVPEAVKRDPQWKMEAYRLALFLSDIAWHDVTELRNDPRTLHVSSQLYRAVGSINANMAEGYAYSTGGNRGRYFEYALGSAREVREWYWNGRHVLGETVYAHRIKLLSSIIALLTRTVVSQRNVTLRESDPSYTTGEEAN